MSIVAFITRDMSGTNQHGTSVEGNPSNIAAGVAKDISLNLSGNDVESYARHGNNLVLTLADGSQVELTGYYNEAATGPKNLFLSDEGNFVEVVLEDKADGMLFASYEPIDISGKWSAYDDMVFLDVERIEPVVAPLVAPFLGGLGAVGAAAAGVAGVAAVAGGGGGDGTGGGGGSIVPTVNDPDDTYLVGEGDPDGVTISGTGEAGSDVEVIIGTTVVTTVVDDDGTWTVNVPTDELPEDGEYETVVNVVAPDGTEYDDIDGPTISIDSEPPLVEITEGTQSVGDIVNGSEQESGTIITGTGEAGATVALTIAGTTHSTTVAEDGTWSLTFSSEEISTGEYETEISITTTDPYGNSTTTTDVLEVDTVTTVAIDSGLSGGDDVVSGAEAAAGVAITGQSEAGASISVVIDGITRTTTADESGAWSVTYENGTLAEGEYSTDITVTATDEAGNTATDTHTIEIDTDAGYITLSPDPIEGDDVINDVERSDGVTITGTATPFEEVTVSLGDAEGTTTADADGNWSYDFEASEVPEGTETLEISASISDETGNSETATDTVNLDTVVTDYEATALQTSDDTLSLDELRDGITLSGTVEVGSTVTVQLDQWGDDAPRSADVDENGNWTLHVDAEDLNVGDYTATGVIEATDPAGNVDQLPLSFDVDTEFNIPEITKKTVDGDDNLTDLSIESTGDTFTLNTLEDGGTIGAPTSSMTDDGTEIDYEFDSPVPDGTNLLVTSEDAAGNTSSTLVLLEESSTPGGSIDHTLTLSHDGLSDFNVDTLKLNYADNANLTLTEADINGLSDNSNTLTIQGDSDNTVTLTGATNDGTTVIDGDTYNIYSIGDSDTSVLIEDDVNVVI